MFDDSDEEGYVPSIRTPVMKPPEPSGLFYENRRGNNDDMESDDENAFPSDFGDNYVSNWQMVSSDSDLLHETMGKTQQNDNIVNMREGDSMIWHGIEEDEDSGSDYELLPAKKEKKSMTRMRKNDNNTVKSNDYIKEIPIITSASKSRLEIEKNTKLVNVELVDDEEDDDSVLIPTETITDDDDDDEVEEKDDNLMYVEDFEDFDNFDAKPVPKKNTIPASKRIKKPTTTTQKIEKSRNISTSKSKLSTSPTKVTDEINMDLLRDAFDATYVDEIGADSVEFSRIIRTKLNAPNLADDVLALETSTVSWSTVAVLARIYKTYRPSTTAPLTAASTAGDVQEQKPSPTKPAKSVSIVEVEERSDVTAESEDTLPAPVSSNSPKLSITKNKPLPTVPTQDTRQQPPLEKEVVPAVSKPMKSVNPITKKKGVFGFTQYQTDESFNDDELDDSNDSISDASATKTVPLPVSPMRVEIKRAVTVPSSETVPAADSEPKKEIVQQIESSLSVQTTTIATSEVKQVSVPSDSADSTAGVDFSIEKKSELDQQKLEVMVNKVPVDEKKENNIMTPVTTPLKSVTATTSFINTPRRVPVTAPPASSLSVLKSLLPHSKLPVIEAELAESTVPFPPKLSKLAMESGVILEGWLEKKSATTGMWLKRYYVFSESETDFAVLRIYKSAVKSLWGDVPTKLKGIIPVSAIASIDVVATKSAKGREFTIVTHKTSHSSTSKYSSMFLSGGSNFFDNGSDKGSVASETGNGKSLVLRAPDAVTRLTWETYINGAMKLLTEME
jgi:archaellum component FlaF (FlaF/FlaG flagellin family)